MLDTITHKFRSWKTYRSTYDELSKLSNRELLDLGIGRADIEFVARRAVR